MKKRIAGVLGDIGLMIAELESVLFDLHQEEDLRLKILRALNRLKKMETQLEKLGLEMEP